MDNKIDLAALDAVVDIYIRVSTTEQAEEGYSVEEQEAKLRAYCQAMDYKINRVARDPGYSGASLDRPGIKEVIADVKAGRCRKVLVWKLDRLSRSQKDTLVLLEDIFGPASCAFVSLNENFDTATPIGRCIVGVLAAFAQMERENIKMRTMMGKSAAVRAGRYMGPRAPFGYKYRRLDNGKQEIVPDAYSAAIVKEIYTMYNGGAALGEVARYVEKTYGCFSETKDDRSIPANRIRRIMANPVYCGKVHNGAELYAGAHEAIVDQETWNAANTRISENAKCYERRGRIGLLSGIIYCGYCGSRMPARKMGKPGNPCYKSYYTCYSVSRCCKNMIKDPNCINRKNKPGVEELDRKILAEIGKLAAAPAAFDHLKNSGARPGDNAAPMRERLEEVERQLSRLLNLYQSGLMDFEEIKPRIESLKAERGKLSETLEKMEKESGGKLSKKQALDVAGAFPAAVACGDPDELRRLIRALIEKVTYLNGKITIYWKF